MAEDTGEDTGYNALADFLLEDVNSFSPLYGQTVSPRDYLEQVSGWYFLHGT